MPEFDFFGQGAIPASDTPIIAVGHKKRPARIVYLGSGDVVNSKREGVGIQPVVNVRPASDFRRRAPQGSVFIIEHIFKGLPIGKIWKNVRIIRIIRDNSLIWNDSRLSIVIIPGISYFHETLPKF